MREQDEFHGLTTPAITGPESKENEAKLSSGIHPHQITSPNVNVATYEFRLAVQDQLYPVQESFPVL
jgi:hypothetical protein